MNASGTLYNQTAPVSALVNAGWTKVDGYNAYQLVSVDGLYQFFDTYAAQGQLAGRGQRPFYRQQEPADSKPPPESPTCWGIGQTGP